MTNSDHAHEPSWHLLSRLSTHVHSAQLAQELKDAFWQGSPQRPEKTEIRTVSHNGQDWQIMCHVSGTQMGLHLSDTGAAQFKAMISSPEYMAAFDAKFAHRQMRNMPKPPAENSFEALGLDSHDWVKLTSLLKHIVTPERTLFDKLKIAYHDARSNDLGQNIHTIQMGSASVRLCQALGHAKGHKIYYYIAKEDVPTLVTLHELNAKTEQTIRPTETGEQQWPGFSALSHSSTNRYVRWMRDFLMDAYDHGRDTELPDVRIVQCENHEWRIRRSPHGKSYHLDPANIEQFESVVNSAAFKVKVDRLSNERATQPYQSARR